MGKFTQLFDEFDKLYEVNNKLIIIEYDLIASGEENSFGILEQKRMAIAHTLMAGLTLCVPYILDNRIDFNSTLLKSVIGLRQFFENIIEDGLVEGVKEYELKCFVAPCYITISYLYMIEHCNLTVEEDEEKRKEDEEKFNKEVTSMFVELSCNYDIDKY